MHTGRARSEARSKFHDELVDGDRHVGVHVLSPADPRIVAAQGEFLFVASDPIRSVRLVQDRHLESIRASDFLWVVCPDGYVGQSASMEIGFAAAVGVPILASRAPNDLTLRQYVQVVSSLGLASRTAAINRRQRRLPGILIDPRASLEKAHDMLERIGAVFTRPEPSVDPANRIHRDLARLRSELGLPTYMH